MGGMADQLRFVKVWTKFNLSLFLKLYYHLVEVNLLERFFSVLKNHSTGEAVNDKSNKCIFDQPDFASPWKRNLRIHLKMQREDKFNKCNQCEYASYRAGDLRSHLKTHSKDKSNKCSQCQYTSTWLCNLRRHLKTHIVIFDLFDSWINVKLFTQWTKIK